MNYSLAERQVLTHTFGYWKGLRKSPGKDKTIRLANKFWGCFLGRRGLIAGEPVRYLPEVPLVLVLVLDPLPPITFISDW